VIPRLLAFLPYLRAHPDTLLAVSASHDLTVPFLGLLGFPAERLVELPRGSWAHAHRLLFPPPASSLPRCYALRAASVLPAYVAATDGRGDGAVGGGGGGGGGGSGGGSGGNATTTPADPAAATLPTVVLLRRSSTPGACVEARCLTNFDALTAALSARLGGAYTVVVAPPDGPFGDRLRLFRTAAALVGVHGAGLANALFLPPGASVFQVWGAPHDLYRRLADAQRGVAFVAVTDVGIGTTLVGGGRSINVSLVVDAVAAGLGVPPVAAR